MRKSTFVLSLLSVVSLGCAGGRAVSKGDLGRVDGDRTLVSHSEGVKPLWVQECPVHSDHVLTFCGETHRKASYQVAYSEAYADALGKLRRFIGQKVEAKLEPDGQGGYRFEMRGMDDEAVTLRGVWEGERWAEIWASTGAQSHDCYVMLSYPRLEYDKLAGRAQALTRQRVEKATELQGQARTALGNGSAAEAAVLLERAQVLLAALKEPLVTPDGQNSTLLLEQIQADLRQAAQQAQEAKRTALVVVGLQIDGDLKSTGALLTDLQNTVQKWVSSAGVKIRPGGISVEQVRSILQGDAAAAKSAAAAKGAGMLLVVDLRSEHKTFDEGVHYSYASGGLRFIRTDDGRELYTSELRATKGALFTLEGSHKKALENLMKQEVQPAVKAAVAKAQ